jgi:hypothetical protein
MEGNELNCYGKSFTSQLVEPDFYVRSENYPTARFNLVNLSSQINRKCKTAPSNSPV